MLEKRSKHVEKAKKEGANIDACSKTTSPCKGSVATNAVKSVYGTPEDVGKNDHFYQVMVCGNAAELCYEKEYQNKSETGKNNAGLDTGCFSIISFGNKVEKESLSHG